MEPLLTIAIPTIEKRKVLFNELYNELKKQSNPYQDLIEIIYLRDDGKMSIGNKRNELNNLSKGKYVVQWDDDDWIMEGGIDLIMEGIKTDADVISFDQWCDIEQWGKLRHFHKYCSIKNAPPNSKIDYENGIIKFTPDQKNAIKTNIAKQIKFYDLNHAEDSYYMRDILPLLKTEHYINKFIYLYLNRGNETMNPLERYKIKKSSKLL
jgi:glycosyltransferase involved in cell wall biosynthesis